MRRKISFATVVSQRPEFLDEIARNARLPLSAGVAMVA
jgi:hypothetical protein